jgi:hypothetical protein
LKCPQSKRPSCNFLQKKKRKRAHGYKTRLSNKTCITPIERGDDEDSIDKAKMIFFDVDKHCKLYLKGTSAS